MDREEQNVVRGSIGGSSEFDKDPDFELSINMPDREVTMKVESGEDVALNTPEGEVFAYLSIEEYNE